MDRNSAVSLAVDSVYLSVVSVTMGLFQEAHSCAWLVAQLIVVSQTTMAQGPQERPQGCVVTVIRLLPLGYDQGNVIPVGEDWEAQETGWSRETFQDES